MRTESPFISSQAVVPVQVQRPLPARRDTFAVFKEVPTRWSDNDVYGHVNNVVYYQWFDTAINAYLMEQGVLDIHHGDTIGLVVESGCHYFAPLAYPQRVDIGIRVAKLGSSSVVYEVGAFAKEANECAAVGRFVHVYVDKTARRPKALSVQWRQVLQALCVPS